MKIFFLKYNQFGGCASTRINPQMHGTSSLLWTWCCCIGGAFTTINALENQTMW